MFKLLLNTDVFICLFTYVLKHFFFHRAHRIKQVMPLLKRFDIGIQHAKNLLWTYFDGKHFTDCKYTAKFLKKWHKISTFKSPNFQRKKESPSIGNCVFFQFANQSFYKAERIVCILEVLMLNSLFKLKNELQCKWLFKNNSKTSWRYKVIFFAYLKRLESDFY